MSTPGRGSLEATESKPHTNDEIYEDGELALCVILNIFVAGVQTNVSFFVKWVSSQLIGKLNEKPDEVFGKSTNLKLMEASNEEDDSCKEVAVFHLPFGFVDVLRCTLEKACAFKWKIQSTSEKYEFHDLFQIEDEEKRKLRLKIVNLFIAFAKNLIERIKKGVCVESSQPKKLKETEMEEDQNSVVCKILDVFLAGVQVSTIDFKNYVLTCLMPEGKVEAGEETQKSWERVCLRKSPLKFLHLLEYVLAQALIFFDNIRNTEKEVYPAFEIIDSVKSEFRLKCVQLLIEFATHVLGKYKDEHMKRETFMRWLEPEEEYLGQKQLWGLLEQMLTADIPPRQRAKDCLALVKNDGIKYEYSYALEEISKNLDNRYWLNTRTDDERNEIQFLNRLVLVLKDTVDGHDTGESSPCKDSKGYVEVFTQQTYSP